MDQQKVGIILLNWNGLNDTVECISSILKSSWKNTGIYVVDNASRDNEADKIQQQFPTVKVLKQKENLGFCQGNNVGIAVAVADNADFILLLNNDTIIPPDMIEKMMVSFSGLDSAGALSPLILDYPNTNNRVQFSGAEWIPKKAGFSLTMPGKDYEGLVNRAPYQSEFACGCCLLTTTAIIREVGMLDERYFAYYDEADWCRRLSRKGYKSYVVPMTSVYHRISRSNTISPVAVYLLSRNRLLWMKDHLSMRERWRSYPMLLKELFWHLVNVTGLKKIPGCPRQESRAYLRGYKDYLFKRFGRWGGKTEKILFKKKIN